MLKGLRIKRLSKALIILYILNLFDLFFTYIGLQSGYITEVNPLMNKIYNNNPIIFIVIKTFIVLIGILIINILYTKKKWVKNTVTSLNALYSLIFIMHIYIVLSI